MSENGFLLPAQAQAQAQAQGHQPALNIYNSFTKEKEVFVTKVPNKVSMYVCGVTPYDFSHIGHARAYVAFDVLYRYLKELGYDVTYVRNFTDVDDKIIRKAKDLEENNPDDPLGDPLRLSNHFCEEFLKDMNDLQCLPPTHQPRVSDHMDQIIQLIAKIIEKGYAYLLDGDVYFAVNKFPKYGQLSRRKAEDNRAGERVSVNVRKQHPADFALWKAAKLGEPSWNSPWGPGRPGWHIECSAMSAHYLTSSFDIHGGGMDLIFPHHENELAQSCAACEETHIGYWVHNGFVTINEEKMSKSVGNFYTIRAVTKQYHPLALRYFLLSMHYKSPANFSLPELHIASGKVFRIYEVLQDCREALLSFDGGNIERQHSSSSSSRQSEALGQLKVFWCKMSDDLHTADVLSDCLHDLVKSINSKLELKNMKGEKKKLAAQSLIELENAVRKILDVLGLLSPQPYSEVLKQLREKALVRAGMTEEELFQLIEERSIAKNNKDYDKSDRIRDELVLKGINLMDIKATNVPMNKLWIPSKVKHEN